MTFLEVAMPIVILVPLETPSQKATMISEFSTIFIFLIAAAPLPSDQSGLKTVTLILFSCAYFSAKESAPFAPPLTIKDI